MEAHILVVLDQPHMDQVLDTQVMWDQFHMVLVVEAEAHILVVLGQPHTDQVEVLDTLVMWDQYHTVLDQGPD